MAIALRIIAILIGLYMIYILGRAINKMHLNNEKLRTFTLLLPRKCILRIRDKKDGVYTRGYFIRDNNPLLGSTDVLLTGYDINPYKPDIDENAPRTTIRIPHELILNDLVDVKYLDNTEHVTNDVEEEENTINERKKKKGSR